MKRRAPPTPSRRRDSRTPGDDKTQAGETTPPSSQRREILLVIDRGHVREARVSTRVGEARGLRQRGGTGLSLERSTQTKGQRVYCVRLRSQEACLRCKRILHPGKVVSGKDRVYRVRYIVCLCVSMCVSSCRPPRHRNRTTGPHVLAASPLAGRRSRSMMARR